MEVFDYQPEKFLTMNGRYFKLCYETIEHGKNAGMNRYFWMECDTDTVISDDFWDKDKALEWTEQFENAEVV